jgi:NAD+ kinase
MDIALVPNRDKPDAVLAAEQLYALLGKRQGGMGQAAGGVGRLMVIPGADQAAFAEFKPELLVVLGGDGSILTTAHALGGMCVPVLGINFGKLGYLAAYSLDEFIADLDSILAGKAPTTERLMLQAAIYSWKHNGVPEIQSLADLEALTPRAQGLALNDVVINAGEPFRMIEMEVQIDEERTTTFRSDGLVVATASGSTGYNLSAGGPLISPEVEAMVMAPICPYTLSFRPVVLPATASILVCPYRLNPGSRVNFDGQVNVAFGEDECLLIRRAANSLTLVENPRLTHWQMLAHKMHWAQSPRH